MATISSRKGPKGTHYLVRIRITGLPHESATFDTKTEAKEWAQAKEVALKSGRSQLLPQADPSLRRRTLGALIKKYREEGLPLSCAGAYKAHLKWWENALGTCRLLDIHPAMIASCREEIAKKRGDSGKRRGPATVNRYLSTLSAVFAFGQQEEVRWTDYNPVRAVRKKEEPAGRDRFLSRPEDEDGEESELERLLNACRKSKSPDLYDLVILGILTGMREGEILALRRHYVRPREGGATLPPAITKNGAKRFVPLVGEALEIVMRRMQSGRDFLFGSVGRKNAHAGVPAFPRSGWNTALRRARIANFKFHDLRHTHGSYLAMKGASTRELMGALGHKTPSMAARYSHLTSRHQSEVASRLLEIEGIR